MREIKFRSWDAENKKMMICGVIPKLMSDGFNAIFDGYDRYYTRDFPVMQFTGLKDKNGIEIYEGDIVITRYGRSETINKVEYTEIGFAPLQVPVDYDEVYADSEDWEVIGNIHQNPELIKE